MPNISNKKGVYMKTRRLIPLLTTGILATTVLVGCLSSQSASNQVQSVEDVKTVGFMKLANENKERIWFKVYDSNDDGEISKDDRVDRVFIIKNGKADVFHAFEAKLTDFKDKNDKEVIDLIKQMDKKYFDKEVEDVIGSINSHIARTEDEIKELQYDEESQNASSTHKTGIDYRTEQIKLYQQRISEFEKLEYKDVRALYSNYVIKSTVKTDSSGNNVASEEILLPRAFKFHYMSDSPDDYNIHSLFSKLSEDYYEVEFQVQGDIYKQTYQGYKIGSSFFITTSLDNSVNLGLDTLDTKNVTEE